METEIIKNRSVGACIKDAFELFANNMGTILRRTWLPVLLLALCQSLYIFGTPAIEGYTLPNATVDLTRLIIIGVVAVCVVVGIIIFSIWANTRMMALLTGMAPSKMFWRIVRCVLLFLVIGAVAGGLSYLPMMKSGHPQPTLTPGTIGAAGVITLVLMLVIFIAVIPVIYSSMKYLVEPEQKVLSIFGHPYLKGWRHWGFLFLLVLLTGIIVMVVYIPVQAPVFIISKAMDSNLAGMIMGDPDSFGLSLQLLSYVIISLCVFISAYVSFWMTAVLYFAYGSIEARIQSREIARANHQTIA